MHTAFTLWMNFSHVQMICIADCMTVFYCLYVYDMFHILLSCDSQGSMECMYVCMFMTHLVVSCTCHFSAYIVFYRSPTRSNG
jgi:uncharacterized membrane protein YozB (DUF420 family)